MTQPADVNFDLILPEVPEITSAYDIANQVDVTSPDTNCVRNIKVSLAGFVDITDAFMDRNRAAWASEGESWPDQDNYKLDGYTLFFDMELSDTNAAAVCVQKGYADSDADYTCFALKYNTT